MTLIYHGSLPPGALVSPTRPAPKLPRPADGAAIPLHFTARAADLTGSAGDPARIIRWAARDGAMAALPIGPNADGTVFEPTPAPPALRFEAETHGGLVLSEVIAESAACSFGLIFQTTEADAETLLTLQPLGLKDYLFLAGRGGEVLAGQDAGVFALSLPLIRAAGQVVLVLCGLTGRRVSVAVNDLDPVTGTLGPGWTGGAADLFIGCRGQRAGLRRKLGSFRLCDVMVWPDRDCLADPADAGVDAARALWHERQRDVA
ncbi:MAG: hypothetical protein GC186_01000 [Rhodobacteraceae bacterium]|nr:hypothetical protein [Paracoccaceae bacterium]